MAALGARSREDWRPGQAQPGNDVYTALLAVALVALTAGCVVLGLDYSRYPDRQPDPYQPPALKGNPAPVG
jgi:hypothetical protein